MPGKKRCEVERGKGECYVLGGKGECEKAESEVIKDWRGVRQG